MPIVGEAIIVVRVVSDRLAADIRDAVKRGMARAAPDIDDEGEAAGERLATGMNRGVRKNRDKIGKELELSATRFISGAGGVFDREGRKLGARFGDAIADGVRKSERRTRGLVDKSVSRALALRSSSEIDRIGRDLGTRFTRAIGEGIAEGDVGKELAIRPDNLERQGQETGRRFGRAIGSGVRGEQDDIWDNVRRSFNMRPGDIDDDGRIAAERYSRGFFDGFKDRLRGFRDSGERAANNISAGLGRGFRSARAEANRLGGDIRRGVDLGGAGAERAGDRIGNGFTRGFARARAAGTGFLSSLNPGFTVLGRNATNAGNQVGQNFGNGVRSGVNRRRSGLLSLFSGIGGDLGKHFNLGIGASKMGEGIISLLTTAGPSLLAGAAALGTALAAEIIVAMAAIGPGIAGAIGVGLAAVSSLALNVGLLAAAFKLSGDTLTDVKKQFGEMAKLIGTPIAEGMLSGFSDTVTILTGSLPELNDVLRRTGEAFGGVMRSLAETVSSAENLGRIKGILETNIGFVDNFKVGISGLVTSFLILFNASKPFIDYIGEGVKRFGEWASASLAVSEANGNLATWMDGMLASFKDLWGIVKNFGKGIGNIFSAAAPAGESLLGSIRGIAERFNAWTSDTANMARMEAFFEKAHILSSAVFDVLGAIFTAGGKAFEGMDLGPILHVLDTLENVVAPAIARMFNQIQAGASENLVKAFDNIGIAFTKIADSGAFEKVAEFISGLFVAITDLAATDFGSTVLSWVLPIALMGGIVTSLLGPLFSLGSGLYSAAAAMGLISAPAIAVAAAVAAVAATFVTMWNNSERLRDAVGGLVKAVGGTFSEIWNKIVPKVQALWEAFQELAGVIGDRLAPVIEFLTPIVQRVFNFIGDTLGNVVDVARGFIEILIGIFTGDWSRIWEGVVTVLTSAKDQVVNVFNFLKDMVSFAWDAITAVIYNAGQVIYGFVTSAWQGISSFLSTSWDTIKAEAIEHWNGIWAFFEGIWNQITTAFHVAVDAVKSFLSTSWDTVKQEAINHWNGIFAFFEGIWNQITTAFHVAVDAVKSWLSSRWDDFKTDVTSKWNSIWGFFETLWGQIDGVFHEVVDGIVAFLQGRWDDVLGHIHAAWDGLGSIVRTIWEGVKDAIWQPIADAWTKVDEWIGKIVSIVKGVIDTVTAAFTTVTGIVADILLKQGEAVKAVIESPTGGVNSLAPLGPRLKGILDPIIQANIMTIPALAKGGIIAAVPGGQLVRAGEAGRPERIDPIQKNGLTARDEALIRMMSAQLAGVRGSGNDVNVNVSLGERSLEAFVTSVIKRNDANNARRVGRVRPT